MRTATRPAALVSYGIDGQVQLPFTWSDGVATARIAMPAREVKVVHAIGSHSGFEAAQHWWTYQQRMWHPAVTPSVDLEPYRHGKWADPTLDLRRGARLTTTAPTTADWVQPAFDDSAWTPCSLGILNYDGAAANQPVWVRRSFLVPDDWNDGGQIRLVAGSVGGAMYIGQSQVELNGTPLTKGADQFIETDVTRLLQSGPNVLTFEFSGNQEYQGIAGQVYLYHRARPVLSVPLTGQWIGRDAKGNAATIEFPGSGVVAPVRRTVFIPASWRGRYAVRLYLEGERYCIRSLFVNNKLASRSNPYPAPNDLDITNLLKYGADNTLVLPGNDRHLDVQIIRLDVFPLGQAG
jgi:hypothetical protein